MKIISWNVNGIRAAIKKGFIQWLEKYNPDVICLQEIKANKDQLDIELFNEIGYDCYIHSANKKGYSGVAILSKIKPKNVEYGCGINEIDFACNINRFASISKSLIRYLLSPTIG